MKKDHKHQNFFSRISKRKGGMANSYITAQAPELKLGKDIYHR